MSGKFVIRFGSFKLKNGCGFVVGGVRLGICMNDDSRRSIEVGRM